MGMGRGSVCLPSTVQQSIRVSIFFMILKDLKTITKRGAMSKTVIGASQFGGQGLFANVPFNVVYEQVLCEAPHVCCVTEKALKTTCINCWSRCEKLLRCSQCKNASFCSALCQKESWKMHLHKGECLVAPDRTEDSVRLVLRLLFRGETTRPLGDVAVLLGEAQRLHYAELAAVLVGRLARAGHAKFDENGVAKALFQLSEQTKHKKIFFFVSQFFLFADIAVLCAFLIPLMDLLWRVDCFRRHLLSVILVVPIVWPCLMLVELFACWQHVLLRRMRS